jgi:hypothetical protein
MRALVHRAKASGRYACGIPAWFPAEFLVRRRATGTARQLHQARAAYLETRD